MLNDVVKFYNIFFFSPLKACQAPLIDSANDKITIVKPVYIKNFEATLSHRRPTNKITIPGIMIIFIILFSCSKWNLVNSELVWVNHDIIYPSSKR